jgi:hypothetical protein
MAAYWGQRPFRLGHQQDKVFGVGRILKGKDKICYPGLKEGERDRIWLELVPFRDIVVNAEKIGPRSRPSPIAFFT